MQVPSIGGGILNGPFHVLAVMCISFLEEGQEEASSK
jgi:hypothetical protein